jgi:hypothetical protein
MDPGAACCPDRWAGGAPQPHRMGCADCRWAPPGGARGRRRGASHTRPGPDRRVRRDVPLPLVVAVLVDHRGFSENWPARTIVSLSVAPERGVESACPVRRRPWKRKPPGRPTTARARLPFRLPAEGGTPEGRTKRRDRPHLVEGRLTAPPSRRRRPGPSGPGSTDQAGPARARRRGRGRGRGSACCRCRRPGGAGRAGSSGRIGPYAPRWTTRRRRDAEHVGRSVQADGSESSTDTTGRVKTHLLLTPSASYPYVLYAAIASFLTVGDGSSPHPQVLALRTSITAEAAEPRHGTRLRA